MDIKKRANQIAHRFQSRNPFEIVRGLNVILVDAPLSGVRGFYQYFQRNHIIYLDETLSEQERTLVLAHELGHLFLHKKANAIFMDTRTHLKTAEYETEADTFAIELLLPDGLTPFLRQEDVFSYYTRSTKSCCIGVRFSVLRSFSSRIFSVVV